MATISTLNSKLTLNTRSFTRGVDRAKAVAKRFGKGIARNSVRVAKYGGALTAVAVGALVLITKHHLQAIDASAKFADSVGLSTETLGGWRHSAELTGTSQATLEKGLQRMVRVIGEAQQGLGTSTKALEDLGLSAEQLAAAGPEEALLQIADAIKAQPDATSKAAKAYALFGRQGQEMITFLDLGSEGLRSNAAEAVKMGLAYSRIDAAKVEAANDSITRVKGLVQGAGQALTIQLAPFIDAAAVKLLEMGTAGGSMGSKVISAVEFVSTAIAKVADGLGFFKAAFHGAQAVATGAIGGIVKALAFMGTAIVSVLNLIPGVELRASEFANILADDLLKTAGKAAEKSQEAFDSAFAGKNSANVASVFAEIREKAQAAAEAIHNQNDAVQEGAVDFEALEQSAKNAQKVTDTLAGLDQQLQRFGQDDIQIKIADLDALGATNEQLERARQTLQQIKELEAGRERQGQIADTLEDLGRQVRTFGLSQKDLTLLDLDALGATEDQLTSAAAAMDQLQRLQARAASPTDGSALVRAGSAEAQRLAFQATRGNQARSIDETPKKQLNVQQQMAGTLSKIEQNQRTSPSEEFDI